MELLNDGFSGAAIDNAAAILRIVICCKVLFVSRWQLRWNLNGYFVTIFAGCLVFVSLSFSSHRVTLCQDAWGNPFCVAQENSD